MNTHTDKNFENRLTVIRDQLSEMSAVVEKQLSLATACIKSKDSDCLETIKKLDLEVDDFEKTIRDDCFEVLTLHQPVASDLRLVFTALKVSKEMERIGDHCRGLSNKAISTKSNLDPEIIDSLSSLGSSVHALTHEVFDSLFKGNEEKAKESWRRDLEIDKLYKSILKTLIDKMEKDDALIESGTQHILIAKSLERIGDHAANIAEEVIFNISGQYQDLEKIKI
ncbi:MAG: phosphate signaling complex protein PhoU [Proteobacteria bacterium]|nr:phosphate signaling complex protein PhoU [Pseudomonadota bacterium]